MDKRPIGVFDSGIGGLTVVHAIRERLPGEHIVYFGDTARLPYGNKTAATVTRFSREIVRFLLLRDVKAIVVACNTASSLALDTLTRESPVDVLGVIEPGAAAAVAASREGRIGVIGTRATIASGAYRTAIQRMQPDATVTEVATPLFVHLVEEGWIEGDVPERVADHYLSRLRGDGVDTVILGCTHYPLLRRLVAHTLGEGVTLVDSARETAAVLERALDARHVRSDSPGAGTLRVYASDTPDEMRRLSERFLEQPVETVHAVEQSDVPWYERS